MAISSQCAAALEHLAAFHFRAITEERDREGAKQQLQLHLSREPRLFSASLEALLHMIVFEDCPNQWSLSRPLLALVLTNEDVFNQWKASALAQQSTSSERGYVSKQYVSTLVSRYVVVVVVAVYEQRARAEAERL